MSSVYPCTPPLPADAKAFQGDEVQRSLGTSRVELRGHGAARRYAFRMDAVQALSRASNALAERRFEDALAAADEALAGQLDRDRPEPERGEFVERPERARAHHIRGTALLELGRRVDAIEALTRSIQDDGRHYAWSNRAVARRDEGDVEGALADFGEAIRARPDYVHARFNRARLRCARGDWSAAEADYLAVLRGDPRAEPSRGEWAEVRRKQGRPNDDAALADALAAK